MSCSKFLWAGFTLLFTADFIARAADVDTNSISHERMQAIYDEVKAPFKYGMVLEPPAGKKVDCPNVFRYGAKWYMVYVRIMFYFGAFWKPGAFDTFAASRDLVHWTKWDGEHLIKSSEPYDTPFAHKPWIIKQDGVV